MGRSCKEQDCLDKRKGKLSGQKRHINCQEACHGRSVCGTLAAFLPHSFIQHVLLELPRDEGNKHVIVWNGCVAIIDIVHLSQGVFSHSLSEYAITACLYFAKRMPELQANQKAGKWDQLIVEELKCVLDCSAHFLARC